MVVIFILLVWTLFAYKLLGFDLEVLGRLEPESNFDCINQIHLISFIFLKFDYVSMLAYSKYGSYYPTFSIPHSLYNCIQKHVYILHMYF